MTDPRDQNDDPPGGATAGSESSEGPADRVPPEGPATAEPTDSERRAVAADVETPDEPRQLDPTVRYRWLIGPLFGSVAVTLVASSLTYFVVSEFLPFERTTSAAAVGGTVFVLLAVYGVVRTVLLYRSWRYVVRDESLYLTRGVFTLVQTVVPYVRVQHIDTRRSAFERVLGLSTLVVYTAGSRGADVTVPGLRPETAEDLQSRLERLAIASEDEDAV